MKKHFLKIIGIFLLVIIYYWGVQFFPGLPGYHAFYFTPKKYEQKIHEILLTQKKLNEEYLISLEKEKFIYKAGIQFQKLLDEKLFPFWLGTNYDFYGKTEIPGQGEIACGYFVTTVLEDMGVSLEREELAKMASEQMIKNLVSPQAIKRYSNQSLKRILGDIEHQGKGLYIIGLDTHTGFLLNDGNDIYFIHASGRRPWKVIDEKAKNSIALQESKYRVTGHLTGDSFFIENWLNAK